MSRKSDKPITSIALFEKKTVRRVWHEDRWWFSITDIIEVLTDSKRPRKYWSDLKAKLTKEGYVEVSEKIGQLKMEAADGKSYLTDAADTTTMLRIIQSIPSPKAKPFKRWLAEIGTERLEEIENPELAAERMKALYEAKGYPQEWVAAGMRGIAIRNELTDEWEQRGVQEGRDYAILTNEIAQATFGMGVRENMDYKGLKNQKLRDHMTDLELIPTMLGEATATAIHRERDSQGLPRLQTDARDAGDVAGRTRRDIETQTGQPVVSPENYLHLTAKEAKQQRLKHSEQPPLMNKSEETSDEK